MGNSQGRPVVFTDEVNLDHFKLLRVVGKGAFGKVRIVERRDSGLVFALKYIRKDEVVRSENVRNIVRERRMLEHLNHPFLCNLRYSFQDYEYLYLVVDLMSGGDLRFHISRKTFTEEAVRMWVAELGCALRYIHNQGIVHRDVKPDNVLLDAEGHVHLADFNVASDFTPTKPLTSRSGTLAYLAPEVYSGKGYSCQVDWWSLGVLFYECIYNKRPFEGSSHESLANKIKTGKAKFPITKPLVSTSCTSAIKSLMEKNLSDRIGANGFENFTNHPFFYDIDFHALEQKHIHPVFVPSSEKTNFDATYDLEELLLEEAPLEARTKHQKPRPQPKPDASPQERRAAELYNLIEKLFEPFDYRQATFEKLPGAGEGSQSSDITHSAEAIRGHDNTSASTTSTGEEPFKISATAQTDNDDNFSPPESPIPVQPQIATSYMDANARSVPLDGQNPLSMNLPPPARRKSDVRNRAGGGNAAYGVPADNTVTAPPADSRQSRSSTKPSGVLGFLSRKKGRDHSPRSKPKEEGVLGKDGARVVIMDDES